MFMLRTLTGATPACATGWDSRTAGLAPAVSVPIRSTWRSGSEIILEKIISCDFEHQSDDGYRSVEQMNPRCGLVNCVYAIIVFINCGKRIFRN